MNWIHSLLAFIAIFGICHGQNNPQLAFPFHVSPSVEKQPVLTSLTEQGQEVPALTFQYGPSVPMKRMMEVVAPKRSSMDILRHYQINRSDDEELGLRLPIHNQPEHGYPNTRIQDHFLSHHLLRRDRGQEHHKYNLNNELMLRNKKALSVLSRCCPFWKSTFSTSNEPQQQQTTVSNDENSFPPGSRRQYGSVNLQDYDNASVFLRSSTFGGHSIRPYSMRLRWGK